MLAMLSSVYPQMAARAQAQRVLSGTITTGRNEAVAGAKVFTNNKDHDDIKEHDAMTDKDGMASFVLDRPGQWLIRLVHMRRCRDCADADWESFWAAYSFGLK
jgi:uncharacterized GH25 family protein